MRTELPQVEPRIPSVRILVRPENVQGLQIQIDGQPMSTALVGVQRPTDPGPHTIVAYAPGYARVTQRIAIQERENRDVGLTLERANGVVYGAPPAYQPYPPAVQPAQPAPMPGAPPAFQPTYGPAYAAPPVYEAPPEQRPASGGFMLGVDVGLLFPGGQVSQSTGGADTSLGAFTSTGGAVGVNAGFRFVRRLYLGFNFQHGFLGSGNASSFAPAGTSLSASSNTNYAGLTFAYMSNPDGAVGFYGEIGAGYRTLDSTITTTSSYTQTLKGGDLTLGALHIRAGDWVRLIPKISVAGGQFDSASCSGDCTNVSSGSITATDTHSFIFLGVTGYVDFARKH
jgi:hypothetical protein